MTTVRNPTAASSTGVAEAADGVRVRRGPLPTGTGTLLRFALRRDRLRLPVWIGALLLATVATAGKLETLYPHAADRAAIAKTMGSPAALAMTGPRRYVEGYLAPGHDGFGAMLGQQMIGFVGVLIGLMSVLTVVRHTRDEEETGRAELLRSTVVGRHAPLTAALLLVLAANLVLGGLVALGLANSGPTSGDWGGALLYGALGASIGAVFAGVSAVTVQITEHARGASGMAMAVIGVAYALRAAGDVGDGTLSWLSPLGWAQRTYPYVDGRWWPLLPAVGATLLTAGAGYVLSTRRDVGAGLRPPRQGRAEASRALARPFWFALRLQRGLLAGFGCALLLLGAAYGSILGDVNDLLSGRATRKALDAALAHAGGASLAESFASVVMIVSAVVAAVHVVLAALHPRAEETTGRAEPLLATGLSRTRWLVGQFAVALLGSTLVLVLAGVGFGAAGAASTGDRGLLWTLPGAALAYAPGLWVTAGVAAVLYGWLPRAAPVAWLVPVYAFAVGYLGRVLRFPDWLNDLSPFGQVPELPAQDLDLVPLAVLTALAAVLLAVGLWGFRRRDLETR